MIDNKEELKGLPMAKLRMINFDRALKQVKNKKKLVAVDLGAGHCNISIEAAKHFKHITAVDSRDMRVPSELPDNVNFILENAVEHDLSGYDVVFAFGLLYHLTCEEQLKIMSKAKGKTLIIDTHTTDKPTMSINGYDGMLYKESKDFETMLTQPKASTTTLYSFWSTKESLYKMLTDSGFNDFVEIQPEHYPGRTFIVCK
jgi:predicted RNA methylase